MPKNGIFIGIVATVAIALLCFTFMVDLAGQTLAQHMGDVWHSAVVQEKLVTISQALEEKIETQLKVLNGERPDPKEPKQATSSRSKRQAEEYSEDERKTLDSLIEAEN